MRICSYRRDALTNRGDDDVHVLGLLHEKSHFSIMKLLRHFLCISSSAGSFFFDVDFDEFCTEGLDLFAGSRTGVEAADYGA